METRTIAHNQATVHAVSPQGFPVTITVEKDETEALVAVVPALTRWLLAQGFTAPDMHPTPTLAHAGATEEVS